MPEMKLRKRWDGRYWLNFVSAPLLTTAAQWRGGIAIAALQSTQ